VDYNVKIGPEMYSVDASPVDETGTSVMRTGEQTRTVTITPVSLHQLQLLVDGRSVLCFVAPTADGTWVWVEGRARFVEDARDLKRRRSRGGAETTRPVTPPTPATVVRVMVRVGQTVAKAQPLIVVSAMKMEMTLSAPFAGTVTAVNADEGSQVRPGEILVEIEPGPEGNHDE
jgi:biotin carboxyl carrier protein